MDIFIFILSLIMLIFIISFYRLYKSIDSDHSYDNDYFVLLAILAIIFYDYIANKINLLFKKK